MDPTAPAPGHCRGTRGGERPCEGCSPLLSWDSLSKIIPEKSESRHSAAHPLSGQHGSCYLQGAPAVPCPHPCCPACSPLLPSSPPPASNQTELEPKAVMPSGAAPVFPFSETDKRETRGEGVMKTPLPLTLNPLQASSGFKGHRTGGGRLGGVW